MSLEAVADSIKSLFAAFSLWIPDLHVELEAQNLNDVEVGSDECASFVPRRIVRVVGMVEVVLIVGCVVVVVGVIGTSQWLA